MDISKLFQTSFAMSFTDPAMGSTMASANLQDGRNLWISWMWIENWIGSREKSTGNHGFLPLNVFKHGENPVDFPLNQFSDFQVDAFIGIVVPSGDNKSLTLSYT